MPADLLAKKADFGGGGWNLHGGACLLKLNGLVLSIQHIPTASRMCDVCGQHCWCVQTLWHALKAGGAYVVEDISENYIEKPFREQPSYQAIAAPQKHCSASFFKCLK